MSMRIEGRVFSLALLWVFGCQSVDDKILSESWDSAGIQMAFSDLSEPETVPECALADDPELQIGSSSGQGGDLLFDVPDVLGLPDRRIAVVNRGTQEVRVFDEAGEFLFSVGGDGEGPGEFRDPIEIALLPPDTLVVWDWRLGRISVFASNGSFIRTTGLDPPASHPTGHFGVFGDPPGFIIASHDFHPPEGAESAPQFVNLLLYNMEGGLTDTLATLPYGSIVRVDQERHLVGRPIFQSLGTFETGEETLLLADGSRPEVEEYGNDGRLLQIIRWLPPDRKVLPEDGEAFKDRVLAGAEGFRLEVLKMEFEVVPVADSFPAVRNLRISPSGRLWVRTYRPPRSDSETWWAFDSRGQVRCRLSVPTGLTIFEIDDDYLLGKTEDEFGVEFVEKRRIFSRGTTGEDDGG
jgi:hypothetical protein